MKREITEDDLTREDLLQACEDELRELQSSTDKVKRVVTPFKLGRLLVSKIPMDAIMNAERFLVVSDVGLLAMLLERACGYEVDLQKITFLCHTREVEEYARTCFGVKTWLVEYGKQLDDFFAGKLNVSDCVDYNSKGEMKKFDVIVGNPPYQPEKSEKMKAGDGQGTANSIWQFFVERAIDLVEDNGHVLFVTPPNWGGGILKKGSQYMRVQELMFENSILWNINCRTPIDYFNVVGRSIAIGAWHLKKQKDNSSSTLKQLKIAVSDVNATSILEKYFFTCLNSSIIEFHGRANTMEAKRGNTYASEKTKEHPYRLANTSSKMRRNIFGWSSVKNPWYDKKKVMVSDSGAFVIGYENGECGLGEHTCAFSVSNEREGKILENFLRSPIVDYIAHVFVPEASFGFPVWFFSKLPTTIFEHDWHDDLWKDSAKQVFGFTDEEILEINQ